MGADNTLIIEDVQRIRDLMGVPLNEGWKELAIGSVLFLTTVFPLSALSQGKTKHGTTKNNYNVEYAVTNSLISGDQVRQLVNNMFSVGFVSPRDRNGKVRMLEPQDVPDLPDSFYLMVDAEGFDVPNVSQVLDYTLDAYALKHAPRMEKVQIYKLYRKVENGLEGVAIVQLKPYATLNKQTTEK